MQTPSSRPGILEKSVPVTECQAVSPSVLESSKESFPESSEELRDHMAEMVAAAFLYDASHEHHELPTSSGIHVTEIHPEHVSLRDYEHEIPIRVVILDYLNVIFPISLGSITSLNRPFRELLASLKRSPIPGPIDYFCIRSLLGGSGNDSEAVNAWFGLPSPMRDASRAEFRRKYLSEFSPEELQILDSVAQDAHLINGMLAAVDIPEDPETPLGFNSERFEAGLLQIAQRMTANLRSLSSK